MVRDRLGQLANKIFSKKTYIFNNLSFDLLNSRSLPYGGLRFEYSFKTHYYSIAVHWLPRWQDRCYRASRELFSNYLSTSATTAYAWERWRTAFPVR